VTPPLLLDGYASPVAVGATAGIYTAVPVRVRTLMEARATRLPITDHCLCGGVGTCGRCVLDDERFWKRASDE
jgi:hypothetical protein